MWKSNSLFTAPSVKHPFHSIPHYARAQNTNCVEKLHAGIAARRRVSSYRRGGACPTRQDVPPKLYNKRRPRIMSVGVDAHIDPAECNRKIAHAIDKNVKRSVGADDSVRPWGTTDFAATFRKNGNTPRAGRCGHRPLRTYYVVAGNARKCVCASCTGGVEPRPYAIGVIFTLQPVIDARRNIAQRIIHGASAVEQRCVNFLQRMDDRRVIAPKLTPDLRQRQIRHLAN